MWRWRRGTLGRQRRRAASSSAISALSFSSVSSFFPFLSFKFKGKITVVSSSSTFSVAIIAMASVPLGTSTSRPGSSFSIAGSFMMNVR